MVLSCEPPVSVHEHNKCSMAYLQCHCCRLALLQDYSSLQVHSRARCRSDHRTRCFGDVHANLRARAAVKTINTLVAVHREVVVVLLMSSFPQTEKSSMARDPHSFFFVILALPIILRLHQVFPLVEWPCCKHGNTLEPACVHIYTEACISCMCS